MRGARRPRAGIVHRICRRHHNHARRGPGACDRYAGCDPTPSAPPPNDAHARDAQRSKARRLRYEPRAARGRRSASVPTLGLRLRPLSDAHGRQAFRGAAVADTTPLLEASRTGPTRPARASDPQLLRRCLEGSAACARHRDVRFELEQSRRKPPPPRPHSPGDAAGRGCPHGSRTGLVGRDLSTGADTTPALRRSSNCRKPGRSRAMATGWWRCRRTGRCIRAQEAGEGQYRRATTP